MSDMYDIWIYPLQDWWRTDEMSSFMYTGQTRIPVMLVFFRPMKSIAQTSWNSATKFIATVNLSTLPTDVTSCTVLKYPDFHLKYTV